jgi:hypothetical protein
MTITNDPAKGPYPAVEFLVERRITKRTWHAIGQVLTERETADAALAAWVKSAPEESFRLVSRPAPKWMPVTDAKARSLPEAEDA